MQFIKFSKNKRLLKAIALGLLAGLGAYALQYGRFLSRIEGVTWSWRVKANAPQVEPAPDVQNILVDQASLDWGSKEMGWSWPWPREVYTLILSFCNRAHARGVAFDILFTEPSSYGVSDDQAFGAAIAKTPIFIGAKFCGTGKTTLPIPEVATNATALANVSDQPDPDGIFRHAAVWRRDPNTTNMVGSLGYVLWAAVAKGVRPSIPPPPAAAPLTPRGRLLLHFAGYDGSHRSWSAAAIIQSEMNIQSGTKPTIDPAVLSNACVLVGFSAPGLKDLRPTPVNRSAPGVEVHATVLDNFLTGRFLRATSKPSQAASIIGLAILAALLMAFAKHIWQSVIVLAGWPALTVGIGFAMYPLGYDWPVTAGTLGGLLAAAGGMVLNYAEEGRQKAFIKQAFRHYLGEEVINQMLDNPGLLTLGGENREMTFFFSDIEKFSSFSERLSPVDLTSLLNDYLSEMSSIIQSEGGYLDKYIGDAIVAFWNAPVLQPDHAARACRAAVRCQLRIAEKRAEWQSKYGAVLHARIGLNTGDAVVGNMGSSARFNYTVLGDNVNLASRLEGANKAFGTYIMAAEPTITAARSAFPARELARLRVVGRVTPVRVFELSTATPAPAFWPAFEAAVALFREGRYLDAATAFDQWPDDPASLSYSKTCKLLAANPPAKWEGVWNLTAK